MGGAQAYPCILVYAAFEEVGAILPSNVPVGDGQLTLYYTAANGTVTAGPNAPIHVVPVSFGIYTLNGLGAGPALLLDADGNSLDVTNPAHKGDTVSLRGTGLGLITGDERYVSDRRRPTWSLRSLRNQSFPYPEETELAPFLGCRVARGWKGPKNGSNRGGWM